MTYKATVLADTPIHYWRCNEGGGQIAHDIGSNPTHLLGNGAGVSFFGYTGPTSDGGSFLAPRSNGMQSSGQIQSLASPVSIEVWCWPMFVGADNRFPIAWDGVTANYIGILYLTTQKFALNCKAASIQSTHTFNTQAWHHLVGTWDNTTLKLYVDNVLEASQALAGGITFSNPIGLGEPNGVTTNSFQGQVCEAAIYSSALTATQVQSHFNAADQRSSIPAYIFPTGGGASIAGGDNPADLTSVLNSVRKVY